MAAELPDAAGGSIWRARSAQMAYRFDEICKEIKGSTINGSDHVGRNVGQSVGRLLAPNDQLMSECHVLCFKPALRLE